MAIEAITVTVHEDETGERLTVDTPWPFDIEITTEAVEQARPDVLNRDGDRLTFTVHNGTAVYEITEQKEWYGTYVCRLVESTYTPARPLLTEDEKA